ncbi:unnamed protein product [Cercopithifilaria johnstoni]|uniref:Uncharacterized protein n=1 Tax=Cercopithifilaria johnstoni TaxID=2874296 RepID=A0A8J2M2A5_9BILA|nr:unnamed protein product [Cercopithifilaria johnstoni]
MGRVLLKTNRQCTHRTSTLRKTNDGGVSKQLTAAEKRKRMIEAGTKYAAQNRKIKADCSAGTHFTKFSVETVPGSIIKTGLCRKSTVPLKRTSPRKNKQILDTSSNHQSISENILNRSDAKSKPKTHFIKTPLKPINEIFERDDAALTSILNKCPQNSISGRASMFRSRERPSLFPNGVNPLDTAAVKFAKPLSLTALAARSFSLGMPAKIDTASILVTPSSTFKMSKRTPVKTVRFDESVDFRSPKVDDVSSPESSVLKIGKPTSLETSDEMILDLKMKFDDILEKLRNLPASVFSNLKEAVHQISYEKSRNANIMCNRYPFNQQLNSFSELETKEVLPNRCRSSMDCIALRTRRKVRVSQMHTNQESVTILATNSKSVCSSKNSTEMNCVLSDKVQSVESTMGLL